MDVSVKSEDLLPVPIEDNEEAVDLLIRYTAHDEGSARQAVSLWRQYAKDMFYEGPVLWLVKPGFTLMQHAPHAGPCHSNMGRLQDWEFNDEPTKHSLVFWVPRMAEGGIGNSLQELEKNREHLRGKYSLPRGHCDSFGSVALLFALILAHFKRTGERVPLEHFFYAASDSLRSDNGRFIVGNFVREGLNCYNWNINDKYRNFGFFLLGVEELDD